MKEILVQLKEADDTVILEHKITVSDEEAGEMLAPPTY